MADLADVEQAIVTLILSTLYPSGTTQASILGSQCRIYRGWPVAAGLNADLSAGVINVTVSPVDGTGKVTTRYLPKWTSSPIAAGTSITTSSNSIQVAGAPVLGDVVGVLVNGFPYVYRLDGTETVDLVAAGLAAMMQGKLAVTLRGSSVIINEPATIVARVVSDAKASAEVRRQENSFRVACWCPDPISRDSVAAAIDQQMTESPFLTAADSSFIRITYSSTSTFDEAQTASLFRRDLVYCAEYATIVSRSLPSMLFGDAMIADSQYYG